MQVVRYRSEARDVGGVGVSTLCRTVSRRKGELVRNWWHHVVDWCALVVFMFLVVVISLAGIIWILGGEWDDGEKVPLE